MYKYIPHIAALLLSVSTVQAGTRDSDLLEGPKADKYTGQELWDQGYEVKPTGAAIGGAVKAAATVAKTVATAVAKAAPKVLKVAKTAVQKGVKLATKAQGAIQVVTDTTTQIVSLKSQASADVAPEEQPAPDTKSESEATTKDKPAEKASDKPEVKKATLHGSAKIDRSDLIARLGTLTDKDILAFTADMKPEQAEKTGKQLSNVNDQIKAKAKAAADAEQEYLLSLEMKQVLDNRLLAAAEKIANDQPVDVDNIETGLEEEALANLEKAKKKLRERPVHKPKIVSTTNLTSASEKGSKAGGSLSQTVTAGQKFAEELERIYTKKEASESFDDLMDDLNSDFTSYYDECSEDYLFEDQLLDEEDFGDLWYGEGDIDLDEFEN